MSFLQTREADREIRSIVHDIEFGLRRISHERVNGEHCRANFNQICANHYCNAGCLRCFLVWQLIRLYRFLGYRIPRPPAETITKIQKTAETRRLELEPMD